MEDDFVVSESRSTGSTPSLNAKVIPVISPSPLRFNTEHCLLVCLFILLHCSQMASISISVSISLIFTLTTLAHSDTSLPPIERHSVYTILASINPHIDWHSLYPDDSDLCDSGPHGLVCDLISTDPTTTTNRPSLHVTELALGFVSDSSPTPPCSPNASLSATSLAPLNHLKKLFLYRCFTHTPLPFPNITNSLSPRLEELVLIENSALFGSFDVIAVNNFKRLRKVVLIGSGVYGGIGDWVGELVEMEQMRISRNRLGGAVSGEIGKLRRLRVLDLSFNFFDGTVPESIGGLRELLKIDLGSNRFVGRIPESFAGLTNLAFMDLSHNRFSANCGIPLFLAEMQSLKEVYLSGNPLGGQIPEIWENLGGVLGIGFSGMGLVGNIPASMGVFLRNLSYLSLENNRLQGGVPEEFGMLSALNELNLERNLLSGRLPFSATFWAKIGGKLKVSKNNELCVDEGITGNKLGRSRSLGDLKVCSNKSDYEISSSPVVFSGCSTSVLHECSLWFFLLLSLVLVMFF
ncbi:hypothetical protein Sjap_006266 [Stephania japonica]|uniref:Uncharacterized protein n=1 Tax=Stephania japonica TaxID=461633 RepID=A0AAP0PIR2_9MAGN